jgi:hypothetical protein
MRLSTTPSFEQAVFPLRPQTRLRTSQRSPSVPSPVISADWALGSCWRNSLLTGAHSPLRVRGKVHSSASGRGHPGFLATYCEVAGLRWLASSAPSRSLTTGLPRSRLPLTPTLRACFGLSTSPVGSPRPSATLSIWTTRLLIARHGARESEGQKLRGAQDQPPPLRRSGSTPSSIREDASPKPPGCGATVSNDQAVGLPDRVAS